MADVVGAQRFGDWSSSTLIDTTGCCRIRHFADRRLTRCISARAMRFPKTCESARSPLAGPAWRRTDRRDAGRAHQSKQPPDQGQPVAETSGRGPGGNWPAQVEHLSGRAAEPCPLLRELQSRARAHEDENSRTKSPNVAADSSVQTATCRLLFVLVILAHQRRRVVHVVVTDEPTAASTAQQLREAFP